MAYTLAKINIRELKESQPTGLQVYDLIVGLIPIEIEGLSQIADSTSPGADQWSYFPTEKQLHANYSVSENKIVTYSLLVSNKNSANYPLDPLGVGTKYIWPPLLKIAPNVTEKADNILAGLISYDSLAIGIASTDVVDTRLFFGSSFSVIDQEFKLYRIRNNGTIKTVYTGIGESPDFGDDQVTYRCSPIIKKLESEANYGFPPLNGNVSDQPFHNCQVVPFGYLRANPGTADRIGILNYYGFDKETLVPLDYDYDGVSNTISVYSGPTIGAFNLANYDGPGSWITTPNYLYGLSGNAGDKDRLVANTWVNAARDLQEEPALPAATIADTQGKKNTGFLYPTFYDKTLSPFTLNPDVQSTGFRMDEFEYEDNQIRYVIQEQGIAELFNYMGNGYYEVFVWGYSDAGTPAPSDFDVLRYREYYKFNLIMTFDPGNDQATSDTLDKFTVPVFPSYFTSHSENVAGTNVYRYRFDINMSSLTGLYTALTKSNLDDRNVKFYLQYQKDNGQADISSKEFIEETIKAIGITTDATAIDFSDPMLFIQDGETNYRQILQKIFEQYGVFLRYNNDTDTAEVIKIDDASPSVLTVNDSQHKNLKIKTNGNDTYSKVIFKNSRALQGNETVKVLDDYGLTALIEKNDASGLNQTGKTKNIEMITAGNSRADDVAQYNFDNKYIYSFGLPAEDEYLDLKIGDWITVESRKIPEPSKSAKVLITKKTTGETQIGFEAIKFASIN